MFSIFGGLLFVLVAMVGLNVVYLMFEFSEQSLRRESDLRKRSRMRETMFWKLTALTVLGILLAPFVLGQILGAIA